MKARSATVLCSIGSTDPSGAAGLGADLRVFAHLGAVGVCVVTGVSAQNSARVLSVGEIAPKLVTQQLQAIWHQVRPDAVCVGLVPGAAALAAVERFLRRCQPRPPIVVDPVISASSGRRFLGARELRALRRLLTIATVVTPNLSEAAALTGDRVATLAQAEGAARLLAAGGCAALVTGGHLAGRACVDVLAAPGSRRRGGAQRGVVLRRFAAPRLAGTMRGAGGILAAALAVELGRGERLEQAVMRARTFVRRAHRSARPLGSGLPQFLAL